MPSPKKNLDWSFLAALEVGERYPVDISPTRREIVDKTPPTKRNMYLRAMNATWRMSAGATKFVIRLGDFRKKEEFDKAYIWCVEKDGKRMDKLPPVQGFKRAVIDHKKKQAKVAALPAQIAQAQEELAEQRKAHTKPPHIREVTVDDQKKLVELVQAHARGEIIEMQRTEDKHWVEMIGEPNWLVPVQRLRIKPKPLHEIWVLYSRGKVGDIEHAIEYFDSKPNSDPECVVHYREVFPEDEE